MSLDGNPRVSFRAPVNPWILGLVVLLVAELECLLVTNYPIRTELRAAFGLPVYHVLLTFMTLVLLMRWLSPETFARPIAWRISPGWLAAHLTLYGLVWAKLSWLWEFTKEWQTPGLVTFWGALGLILLGTWLLIWLPFQRWRLLWEAVKEWVVWIVPLSLLAPYAAQWASSSWLSFARLTFGLTELLLGIFYLDVVAQPERLLLGTSRFVVEIQPGCSGYEGMGLIAVLVSGYLWLKRKDLKFPLAFGVLPLGVILAYYANVLRLVLLITLGTKVSPEVAMRGFHSQAGWLSFTFLSLAMIYFIEKSGNLRKEQSTSQDYSYLATPYVGPFVGMLATSMLIKALSADFEFFYFLKPLVVTGLLLYWRPKYQKDFPRPDWALAVTGGLVVYVLWIALVNRSSAASPFQVLPGVWGYIWVGARIWGSVLVVPLAEELTFRGYLLRRLQGKEFEKTDPAKYQPTAAIFSSLLFGLLHSDFVAGFGAGLIYGWLSSRPGHLSNAVIAHSLTNGCIAVHAIVREDWSLW